MAEFRTIALNDVALRVAIEGTGPLVVMVHGFPESWYSWRHQMAPIAAAGFTACAIDVRGYGGSGKPHAVEAYTLEAISTDIAGLIAALSPDAPAVVIGHDWGAPIAWTTALVHPDRVRAVAGLSVPYTGIPKRSLNDLIDYAYTRHGRFFYQHYFAQEGAADTEMDADVRCALRRFYYAWSGDAPDGTWPTDKKLGDTVLSRLPDPDPFPAWLSAADIDTYTGEFTRSGFRGGLNRYRNNDRDFAFLSAFKGRRIEQPSLYIAGDRDLVLTMFGDPMPILKAELPGLRGAHILPGCGHWTQQERPAEVNALLLDWLRSLP
jgi:pimeloyl-ACP methyl ester carboxylesterase